MELWNVIFWAVLAIVLICVEIATVQLVSIWFGAGSLIAFIASLFGLPFIAQIVIFIATSIVLLFATRPLVKKLVKNKAVSTNADSLIGQSCIVQEKIDNMLGTGRAYANGLDWMARSIDDKVTFDKDEKCQIVRIEGVKLIVKPII